MPKWSVPKSLDAKCAPIFSPREIAQVLFCLFRLSFFCLNNIVKEMLRLCKNCEIKLVYVVGVLFKQSNFHDSFVLGTAGTIASSPAHTSHPGTPASSQYSSSAPTPPNLLLCCRPPRPLTRRSRKCTRCPPASSTSGGCYSSC